MTQENKENSKEAEEATKEEKPEFEKKLEEMRAENQRMETNIKQLQELKAMDALGGKTENPEPENKEEEITPEKIKGDMDKLGW
jgi:hypothetical protein